MFIFLGLFYGLNSIPFGSQLNEPGRLWVPRPGQLRTADLDHNKTFQYAPWLLQDQ